MKPYVRACLIGLALALLLIGGVSGTLLRHVVQILPVVLVLIVLRRRPALGAYAALPIFIIWIGIVILIWLFLLGLSHIANGHYTSMEIALTLVMAACSVFGAFASFSLGRPLSVLRRVAAFALFGALQLAAMWISFLGPIANR
jgi:hypothetical protein